MFRNPSITMVPMNSPAAKYWYWHVGAAVGWLATGWVTVAALQSLALPAPDRELIAYLLGIVLLAIGIESVWRRPPATLAAAPAATAHGRHGAGAIRNGSCVNRRHITFKYIELSVLAVSGRQSAGSRTYPISIAGRLTA